MAELGAQFTAEDKTVPLLVVADHATAEGGALSQAPVKDGLLTLTFNRSTGASDSGTFAVIELEALEPGKATVMIQDGKYLVGANPIPARYVNSLVTIQ